MAKAKTADKPTKPADAAPDSPAQVDERDAKIAALERTVAEERHNAGALREANDALKFKLEITEKGYSKQLADARQKMAAALTELADHQTRLKDLGSGGEDTLRLLSETRAELNRTKAERDLLKEQMARGGGRPGIPKGGVASAGIEGADSSDGSQTINALIQNAGSKPTRERAAAAGGFNLDARVQADEPPSVEMLSPDLIFTKGDKDDDEKPR